MIVLRQDDDGARNALQALNDRISEKFIDGQVAFIVQGIPPLKQVGFTGRFIMLALLKP